MTLGRHSVRLLLPWRDWYKTPRALVFRSSPNRTVLAVLGFGVYVWHAEPATDGDRPVR